MSSSSPNVRIALAGLGYIGRAHAAAVMADGNATLSGIVDPSPEAGRFAETNGIAHFDKLDDLLSRQDTDGVIVATPNVLHVAQAVQCIDARVALLLEKPVAPTVREARAIEDAARRQRATRLLVGHHRAHSPIMQEAQRIIEEGTLGRLVCISGSATFYKPDEYFRDGPWRREAGGGPILLNLIHEIHNLRMLCGEIASVQAMASNTVRGFAVEDTVAISLAFDNGALGTFLLSDTASSARSWEQTSRENTAYGYRDDEDCYVVSGTQGSLAIPTMRITAYDTEAKPSWWDPFSTSTMPRPEGDPIVRQISHFADVIRGDAEPRVSLQDGIANLMVTEAISRAARTGRLHTIE